MKKYLEDLETELRKNNLSEDEIKDIMEDHTEMIETAIGEGLTDEDLEKKFGNPKDVAEELSQFSEKENTKHEGEKQQTMKSKEFTNIQDSYKVSVALVHEDINFETIEGNKIVVEYYGHRNFERFEVEYNNNEFILKGPKKSGIFGFMSDSGKNGFKVFLPKGVMIGDFKMKEVSGDSTIQDIKAKSFTLETSNGDAALRNFQVEKFNIHTVNGDVSLQDMICDEATVAQVSGDLKMKNVNIKGDLTSNTVSGDVTAEDTSCKEFTLRTVSGDFKGQDFYPESIVLNTVSGDVSITNTDQNRPIVIKHKKSLSGDIEIKVKK